MEPALVAAVAVFLLATLAGERERAPWRVVPKALASAGFVALAVAAGAGDTAYGRWVLAALVLGWVGDVALAVDRPLLFTAGLAAFLVSHIAYVAGFAVLGLRGIAAAVTLGVLAAGSAAVGRWLLPHVPRGLRVPVLAYLAVITVMVAAAFGAASAGAPWPVPVAAVAFAVSDLLVARDQFVTRAWGNRVAGLPLYYAAQVLFALSTGML